MLRFGQPLLHPHQAVRDPHTTVAQWQGYVFETIAKNGKLIKRQLTGSNMLRCRPSHRAPEWATPLPVQMHHEDPHTMQVCDRQCPDPAASQMTVEVLGYDPMSTCTSRDNPGEVMAWRANVGKSTAF